MTQKFPSKCLRSVGMVQSGRLLELYTPGAGFGTAHTSA